MNAYKNIQTSYLNRTLAISNLYHEHSLKLIELILNQNKQALESAHQRTHELLTVKDLSKVHQLVTKDVASQVQDYTNFATSAYQLGCKANSELIENCKSHCQEQSELTHEALETITDSENPINSLSNAFAKATLDASNLAINTARGKVKS
jgi:DNA-binding protein H-NS